MGLIEGTSAEELYQLLAQLGVDIVNLRKKEPSYKDLATLYLNLLDAKISEPLHTKPVDFEVDW